MKLAIPENILTQHVAVLGKTGSGKSSALRHIVEHLLHKQKRVCIIDPKGDWWGLKKSGDGRSLGFDVVMFGDFKDSRATDIPITEHSGKHVAELIATGNRPCVIGFRGWMTGRMIRFWIDFASSLFNLNSGELYLVGDEFHNFAPKGKILDPEAGKCLHWSNRLMSEGRGYGLVCLIASQRPQKVHNDTLTCCETLVAMRVIHKADRDAIQDWIEGCGDMAKGKEVLNALAGMARGEAFVWSPEVGFGPERITFPMFHTFDSFAAPQLQRKVSDSGWNAVDIDLFKKKLASVIEEVKANDPAILKAEIRSLQKQLADVKPSAGLTESDKAMVSQLLTGYGQLKDSVCAIEESFLRSYRNVLEAISTLEPKVDNFNTVGIKFRVPAPARVVPPVSFRPSVSSSRRTAPVDSTIGRCERAILNVLAQYDSRTITQIAVITGYSSNSGGFNNALSRLRSLEYITRGNPAQITNQGRNAAGEVEQLPTGKRLFEHWCQRLGKCEREILRALYDSDRPLSSDEIGNATGYSSNSGGFNNALSRLRTLELITRGQPITISDHLLQ